MRSAREPQTSPRVKLQLLDWITVAASLLICFVPSLFFGRRAGKSTIGLFAGSAGMVYLLDTAKDSFDIILQIGAGTGLLYLLRWFWWRINAWCEVVAMAS